VIPAERDAAETLALGALTHLLAEQERVDRFLAVTGLGEAELRRQIDDPVFLGGVLDFVLQDEALLLEVAAAVECPPERVMRARKRLPGAPLDE
jgi:hypothetical protein